MHPSLTVASSPIQNREQAEALLQVIALHHNALKQKAGELAGELSQVRARFEPEIAELEKTINGNKAVLEAWAWEVQAKEFAEKRSLDLLHGTIGFRFGPRKLALLSRQKWDGVLERLRGRFKKYIRTKEQVNKEQILTDSAEDKGELKPSDLSALGLKVVQEESFFIDLKED